MRGVVRHGGLLLLSAVLTWWVCLRETPTEGRAADPAEPAIPVVLRPRVAAESVEVSRAPESRESEPAPLAEDTAPPSGESRPPVPDVLPPERGTPHGAEEADRVSPAADEVAVADEQPAPDDPDGPSDSASPAPPEESEGPAAEAPPEAERRRPAEELMHDPSLLDAAASELAGEQRKGFLTVLLASPEEQLEIARFFGEELVLVPRDSLDAEAANPGYFRVALDGPRVERVGGAAPLRQYRQYRDLFDYEYSRLPGPLRELRRSVLARNEVYLFAALIPQREWAVVVGRRRDALERTGRGLDDVARFVMRYRKRSDGGFDVVTEEIVFADGSRYTLETEAD